MHDFSQIHNTQIKDIGKKVSNRIEFIANKIKNVNQNTQEPKEANNPSLNETVKKEDPTPINTPTNSRNASSHSHQCSYDKSHHKIINPSSSRHISNPSPNKQIIRYIRQPRIFQATDSYNMYHSPGFSYYHFNQHPNQTINAPPFNPYHQTYSQSTDPVYKYYVTVNEPNVMNEMFVPQYHAEFIPNYNSYFENNRGSPLYNIPKNQSLSNIGNNQYFNPYSNRELNSYQDQFKYFQ